MNDKIIYLHILELQLIRPCFYYFQSRARKEKLVGKERLEGYFPFYWQDITLLIDTECSESLSQTISSARRLVYFGIFISGQRKQRWTERKGEKEWWQDVTHACSRQRVLIGCYVGTVYHPWLGLLPVSRSINVLLFSCICLTEKLHPHLS